MSMYTFTDYSPHLASIMIHTLRMENEALRNHVGELNAVIFNLTNGMRQSQPPLAVYESGVSDEEFRAIVGQ